MTSKQRMTDDGRPIIPSIKRQVRERINGEAWCLIHDGKPAGSIVVAWSRGGTASAALTIHRGPLEIRAAVILTAALLRGESLHVSTSTGTAGGGGYCKASAAVAYAADRVRAGNPNLDGLARLDGRGMGAIESELERHGYTVARVV